MTKIRWYSPAIIKKAMPALIVIFFVFITIMLLAGHIEAFFPVLVLWIALPIIFIQIYRKIRNWLGMEK